jgi:hypothetical protein
MRERWLRIGILAGVVFAMSVAGRLVVRLGSIDDPDTQGNVTWATYGAIGLVLAVVAVWWGRIRPIGVVVADLAGGAVAGCLLNLFVGPFVSGTTPGEVGAGDTFEAAWQFAGFAGGGALVGLLLLIMVGKDHKSQSLKRFAEARKTKPHRPVRR